jgi:hypothetical protein
MGKLYMKIVLHSQHMSHLNTGRMNWLLILLHLNNNQRCTQNTNLLKEWRTMHPWGRPGKLQCLWLGLKMDCIFQHHKGCKWMHPVQTTSLVGIGDSLLGQGLQLQMHNILRYIRNCMGWLLM